MKLADGYLVKEIVGSYVLIPVGQNVVDSKSILSTNETGHFILDKLSNEISYDELFNAMCIEYEAVGNERELLKKDMDEFLTSLRTRNLLCE